MKKAQQGKTRGKAAAKRWGLHLLVVEDQGDFRFSLQAFFELLGHRRRFVADVASALRAASEESFDVLLSEVGLTDGGGWDLLRQLEQNGRRPPYAIAMSGFCLAEHAAKSKAAGFALHLNKPFPPEDLEKALHDAEVHLSLPV